MTTCALCEEDESIPVHRARVTVAERIRCLQGGCGRYYAFVCRRPSGVKYLRCMGGHRATMQVKGGKRS